MERNRDEKIMINIAVCEDDVFLGGQIETMLYRQAETEGVAIQTEVFTSAENCLKYLREECMVDLLFLDIELGKMSGIELAERIRNELHNDYMQIVVVSSKQSYAMELFESHPLHFLVKPLAEEKFTRVFRKAVKLIDKSEETFQYKKGHSHKKVFCSEIIYFEASNREIIMHTNTENEIFYGTLKNIYPKLQKQVFFFCHKSFLVHYDKVKIFETNQLVMQNGDIIPISQGQRKAVKELQLERELRDL